MTRAPRLRDLPPHLRKLVEAKLGVQTSNKRSARTPPKPITIRALSDGWVAIENYHPPNLGNARLHWAAKYRAVKGSKQLVQRAARIAGWRPVHGRARLEIVFVYAQHRRVDADNLKARLKGIQDGLVEGGYIDDDNRELLEVPDPEVRVERGRSATELRLSLV